MVSLETLRCSLTANIDTCDKDTVKDWKVGVEKGKYGPIGEDLFAEMCMRKNGTWINTGMYQQVWKALGKKATYADYWTVKVDA